MKLRIPALLIVYLLACHNCDAQSVNLQLKNSHLKKALEEIRKQTGIHFIYSNKLLAKSNPLTLSLSNSPLRQTLDACFRNQPLTYQIINGTIVVTPKLPQQKIDASSVIQTNGKVTHDGQPLVGVSVRIKDNPVGTTTDGAGVFALHNISSSSALILSSVGFATIEIPASESFLNIEMKRTLNDLDETIVVGYGQTTKRYSTSNVGKIKSSEIEKQPVANLLLAMQGRIPGLEIREISGIPGTAVTNQIRGINSISLYSSPLFIIDNMPFNSDHHPSFFGGPADLEPSPFEVLGIQDIKSVEILKDADATAIYGSRGSNGVVLITTKTGRPQKPALELNLYSGIGKTNRAMKLLNPKDYLLVRKQAFANDRIVPGPGDHDVNGSWDTTRYTNWQHFFFGNPALLKNAEASISGTYKTTSYRFASAYRTQETVLPGDFRERKFSVSARLINNTRDAKLKTDISLSYAGLASLLPHETPVHAMLLPPNAPSLHAADGGLNWENMTWRNPLANFSQTHQTIMRYAMARMQIEYKWTKTLAFRVNSGIANNINDAVIKTPMTFYSPNQSGEVANRSAFSKNSVTTWLLEPTLHYSKTFSSAEAELLLGSTLQQNFRNMSDVSASGFVSEKDMGNEDAAATRTINRDVGLKHRFSGFFGRMGIRIKNRYALNLTARTDGSSRFASEKRYASFYAVGAAWIFSNENFFRAFPLLSFGKLRASIGTSGNDGFMNYGNFNPYISASQQSQLISGTIPSHLARPISWEVNKKLEVGLELGFAKNMVMSSFSYYRNVASNQLGGYAIPSSSGYRFAYGNLPVQIENEGVEIELQFNIVHTSLFRWSTALLGSLPTNKLLSFPNIINSIYTGQYEVGKSLFTKKLLHYAGLNPQTGFYAFADINKNGVVDFPGDLQSSASFQPAFSGGVSTNIYFRGFELSCFFQLVKQLGFNYLGGPYQLPGSFGNQPSRITHSGQLENGKGSIQAFSQAIFAEPALAYYRLKNSDAMISDASFARMKHFSLTYNFSDGFTKRVGVKNLNVFVTGQNVFTLSGFTGWDPETQNEVPPLRILAAGFKISL